MASGVAILLLALVAQSHEDSDVLVLKDGRTLKGLIEQENDEVVVLRIVIKGSKGEIAVSGTTTVKREEIAEIRRIDDDVRERRQEKVEAAEDREWERDRRLKRIQVTPTKVAGRDGLMAAGEFFVVHTTCDEDFARAACDALQQAYEGYLLHFKVRRKRWATLPVFILDSPEEYAAYLEKQYGGTLPGSSGVYFVDENVIVSYNCVQREEAARIREIVAAARSKIEEFRKGVREHEKDVDESAKEAKAKVVAEAAKAKAEIRRADPVNRPALLRKVDKWVEEQFKNISDWKADRKKNLGGFRKLATEGIEACRKVIQHNEYVLRNQNREMLETLFHECFHAFARNLLYKDQEIPRWLNEGMACYFEMSVLEAGELIHGAPNPDRRSLYRELAHAGKLPRLESVLRGDDFVIEHEGHIDRAVAAYAVSWAVAHYVTSRMSRDQMDEYVENVDGGADPAAALARVLRCPLKKIDAEVRAHVEALR